MLETTPRRDSLVLFKSQAARVMRSGKKLEIELGTGQTVSVRPKDVVVLHPGPIVDLVDLQPQPGEPETAWELLAGSTTDLAELADLAYGAYTPPTAWAAWQLVVDGLYFHGSPQEVVARPATEVAQIQAARKAQAAEEEAWTSFLKRLHTRQILPEDDKYLREVEDLALGRRSNSRVLRELGHTQSPEKAHAMLLEVSYWDHRVDPHPQRLGLATSAVTAEPPGLAEETRLDLTHLPAFAIDDAGNQEPDDALSLEDNRLWVHVADASALVPPNSAADLEARARGASLYLPEGTVPMLPLQVIQTTGLGLENMSPALSFGLKLSETGEIRDVEIARSWVRVRRLTYEEAEARLGEEPFCSLHRLAQVHEKRRQERGAITIDLPEVTIRVENDQVIIEPIPQLESRKLVTEAMLMAGTAVARFALEHEIPIPFTTQDPPYTADRPGDLAGMFSLRRAFRPSQPSTTPGAHSGLGLEIYAQVTSPLRRYLDLVVHQQLSARLRGENLLEAQEILERLGATTAVMGSVRLAERLARRHWTLVYLMQHPDWQGEGVLIEQHGRRGTVLIPALDLDAKVHLRQELPLNHPVRLGLREVNLAELAVHFQALD